jgi:hypothetical protein
MQGVNMATHEDMISNYIKLRDLKTAIIDKHKAELKPYNDGMGQIADWLRNYLQEQNLQSVASKEYVAFLKRRRSATIGDMALFREYVISSKDFDMADFHARVEAVEDYAKSHDGQLPPGTNFSTAIIVGVQRK